MRSAAACTLTVFFGLAHGASGSSSFTGWEFYSGKTSRGTGLCSLSIAAKSAPGRNVGIKHLANREGLNVTLYGDDWNYTSGTNVPFSLDFADDQQLKVSGYGDGHVIDVELPKDATAVFLSLLGSSQKIQLYVGEQRQRISVPLAGIQPKLKSFVNCALSQDTQAPASAKNTRGGVNDTCKNIRFTGLGTTRFPYELEDAKKASDLEDYVARNPILCNSNNSCRGIGYFENARAHIINRDAKYLHVMAPVDLTTGRRDIYLAIFRADARCDGE